MVNRKLFIFIVVFLILIFSLTKLFTKTDFDEDEILYVTSTKNIVVIMLKFVEKGMSFIFDFIFQILIKLFNFIFGF